MILGSAKSSPVELLISKRKSVGLVTELPCHSEQSLRWSEYAERLAIAEAQELRTKAAATQRCNSGASIFALVMEDQGSWADPPDYRDAFDYMYNFNRLSLLDVSDLDVNHLLFGQSLAYKLYCPNVAPRKSVAFRGMGPRPMKQPRPRPNQCL